MYLRVRESPAFAGFIEKNYPQKIVLLRVVNEKMSPTIALRGNQGETRVELFYHVP